MSFEDSNTMMDCLNVCLHFKIEWNVISLTDVLYRSVEQRKRVRWLNGFRFLYFFCFESRLFVVVYWYFALLFFIQLYQFLSKFFLNSWIHNAKTIWAFVNFSHFKHHPQYTQWLHSQCVRLLRLHLVDTVLTDLTFHFPNNFSQYETTSIAVIIDFQTDRVQFMKLLSSYY